MAVESNRLRNPTNTSRGHQQLVFWFPSHIGMPDSATVTTPRALSSQSHLSAPGPLNSQPIVGALALSSSQYQLHHSSSSSSPNNKDLPRRLSFGFNNFISTFTNRFQDMSNSPTIGNFQDFASRDHRDITLTNHPGIPRPQSARTQLAPHQHTSALSEDSNLMEELPQFTQNGTAEPEYSTGDLTSSGVPVSQPVVAQTSPPSITQNVQTIPESESTALPIASPTAEPTSQLDKDGNYSIRLTPLIDHSSLSLGLYFSPVIRKILPKLQISIGRYTEKNKAAAHAPQGSLAPIVFKSKVVSRTHALFQCNEDGQWFLKDCKLSLGTFLNHIRLSKAGEELMLMPLLDGDIIQLGMDYRGGTEEVYRCVKMRCEFNKLWQRKVNQFNLEIHKKMQSLSLLQNNNQADPTECAICLMRIEPCQAIFMSPCSHLWHYKCIRPIIIKLYPQFYCPNCRTMCDLETDIEDDD